MLELYAWVGHSGLGAIQESSRHLVVVDFNSTAQQLVQDNAASNGLADQVEFRLVRKEEVLNDDERFGLTELLQRNQACPNPERPVAMVRSWWRRTVRGNPTMPHGAAE